MNKGKWSTALLIVILLAGLSLLLYPSFADYWNSFTQSRAIASYVDMITDLNHEDYSHIWQEAVAYNRSLLDRDVTFVQTDAQAQQYTKLLNLADSGIMGYVEIPSIDVQLAIYHGTEEGVLQTAVGHLDWTSLPTGGESTHCVLSGHRGLPSARLFTDLDKLAVGDYFMLNILDEVLTYEVDQIRVVEPYDTQELLIQEGKDLCTLVTCTPYGVNSHRLLVRGHRVDNMEKAQDVRITADAMVIEKMVVVPFVLAPILLLMLIVLLISTRKKRNRRKDNEKKTDLPADDPDA